MAGEARVQLLVAMYYELICITRKDRLTRQTLDVFYPTKVTK